MDLRTKRVQWASICIVVREQSGYDTFREGYLFWEIIKAVYEKELDYIDIPAVERNIANEMTAMICRTVEISGDLGFEWPKPDSNAAILKAAFNGLATLSGGLVKEWRNALKELESAPLGDPDLVPPEMLSAKKKKAAESE